MDPFEIPSAKPEKWDRVTAKYWNNPNGVPDFQRDIYGISFAEAKENMETLNAYLRHSHPPEKGFCFPPLIVEPKAMPAGSIPRFVRKPRTEFV